MTSSGQLLAGKVMADLAAGRKPTTTTKLGGDPETGYVRIPGTFIGEKPGHFEALTKGMSNGEAARVAGLSQGFDQKHNTPGSLDAAAAKVRAEMAARRNGAKPD